MQVNWIDHETTTSSIFDDIEINTGEFYLPTSLELSQMNEEQLMDLPISRTSDDKSLIFFLYYDINGLSQEGQTNLNSYQYYLFFPVTEIDDKTS